MIDLGDTNRRNTEITQLLTVAKRLIESGVVSLRAASEKIAEAQNQGATQRETAKAVGKSVGWVNGLLKWRKLGYPSETPFGPPSKASRDRARVQSPERKSAIEKSDSPVEPGGAHDLGMIARTIKQRADTNGIADGGATPIGVCEAEAPTAEGTPVTAQLSHTSGYRLDSQHRDLLVEALTMLGSQEPRQRDNAAHHAEQLREKLGMTWNELIVRANEQVSHGIDVKSGEAAT